MNQTGTINYSNAVSWLQSQSLDTTDYLSERIHALSVAGTDRDLLLSYLDEIYTGAWGGYDDFEVNNLDTALALQALKAINYSDQNVISYALGYLLSTQNSDGGWAFRQAQDDEIQDSNVYMTAIVLQTFNVLSSTFNVIDSTNKATAYLLTKQNPNGGFGSGPSTVYETALAYIALVGVTTDATVLGNATNYLLLTQFPNGSWNDDSYSTALAIRALYLAENRPPPPPPPTTGTVTGKAVDVLTNQPLSGVSIVLQADPAINTVTNSTGDFTLSNIPPGSQKINFSLSGYATATATVNIVAGSIINLGTIPLSSNPTTGIIKGTVTDASNGQPLSGVTITVTGSFSGTTVTGADGTFIFTNVTPGSVSITASKTGYYTVAGTGAVVAGGILFFNPQLSTQPPQPTTGNLTGKVFDSSTNKPIQGATISISGGSSGITDAQGIFLIKDIAPNTYQVTISAAGYISQVYQVMIMAGVTTDMQTIYLTPSPQSTTITGKITDASTGKPIVGADVSVVGTSITTKTSSDGTYILSGITLLEFNLKASATGYDSKTYNVKTTSYGIYTVDFSLNPSQVSDIKITSLTTDKQEYGANNLATITGTLENTGGTIIDVFINAQITNPEGNTIAFLSHPAEPAFKLNPYSTETISFQWDTGKNTPGIYGITLSIVDATQGNLLAEGDTSFAITPTVLIDEATPMISPKFLNIKATENVHLAVSLTNRSNIDTSLSSEFEVKDPGGIVITSGTANFSLAVYESFKVIDLTSFTHTFTQSGQYPVKIKIISGSTLLTEISNAIHVAPSIRIEPSKTLIPTTVIPDGDKVIRIDIQIKGVEEP